MMKKKTFNKRLMYSASAALIFVALSLPQTYNLTNMVVPTVDARGCPSPVGLLLHTLVFFSVLFLLMKNITLVGKGKSNGLMAKYAFYSALIFFLLASSQMYSVTSSLLPGLGLTDLSGCPTVTGVLVHGVVYTLVLVAVMYFPKDVSYNHMMVDEDMMEN